MNIYLPDNRTTSSDFGPQKMWQCRLTVREPLQLSHQMEKKIQEKNY